jgi:molybdopterin converting factor small subunit
VFHFFLAFVDVRVFVSKEKARAMSTLRIPPVLRGATHGQKQTPVSGATLRAALDGFFAEYPSVRQQIVTPEGSLSKFVNVYVDDQDVRYLQGLDTPLNADSIIILLPAMAGGMG